MSTVGHGVTDKKARPKVSISAKLPGRGCNCAWAGGDQTRVDLEIWAVGRPKTGRVGGGRAWRSRVGPREDAESRALPACVPVTGEGVSL